MSALYGKMSEPRGPRRYLDSEQVISQHADPLILPDGFIEIHDLEKANFSRHRLSFVEFNGLRVMFIPTSERVSIAAVEAAGSFESAGAEIWMRLIISSRGDSELVPRVNVIADVDIAARFRGSRGSVVERVAVHDITIESSPQTVFNSLETGYNGHVSYSYLEREPMLRTIADSLALCSVRRIEDGDEFSMLPIDKSLERLIRSRPRWQALVGRGGTVKGSIDGTLSDVESYFIYTSK